MDSLAASCEFICLFVRCLYVERILKRVCGMSKESNSVSAIKVRGCNREIYNVNVLQRFRTISNT